MRLAAERDRVRQMVAWSRGREGTTRRADDPEPHGCDRVSGRRGARVASFHCRQSSAMMRHADDVTLDPPGTPDRPAATRAHSTPPRALRPSRGKGGSAWPGGVTSVGADTPVPVEPGRLPHRVRRDQQGADRAGRIDVAAAVDARRAPTPCKHPDRHAVSGRQCGLPQCHPNGEGLPRSPLGHLQANPRQGRAGSHRRAGHARAVLQV